MPRDSTESTGCQHKSTLAATKTDRCETPIAFGARCTGGTYRMSYTYNLAGDIALAGADLLRSAKEESGSRGCWG